MTDNLDNLLEKLQALELSPDEAKVYLELLCEPGTHLRLSHITGINRTKIYRLIENLEKKSLVSRRTDDRGTFLIASDPATLEIAIVNQETKLKQQRVALSQLVPQLNILIKNDTKAFVVRTYEGEEGLKHMCWHQLKTKGELLFLGGQTIEDLISNRRWAEKYRALFAEAGYPIRGIINHDIDPPTFTENQDYMKLYSYRKILSKLINFNEQITIYNNTVAVYHWRENQKVGIEIISKTYITMMRQMFEHFWAIAEKV
jgi:DNA-binding MarR family transcriptional regulator